MSILDIMISDCIISITKFLNDKENLRFLSISKDLHLLKDKINYDDEINIDRIHQLWYYDRFTNIMAHHLLYKFPKSITHLEFDDKFDQNIKECIPTSV